ncbi:SUMF1/EgtB/PvdO family nonheme iron enzyme [Chryseolinea sp. H1M3-3]|uniref:SUMF1/EgtB/PvdO family nonheme iron enzyme n=1 Tax=Chryseolinea sp. H1M3-3 TaxID=3034144 RepID=UPI0023EB50DD|nr:SUMF1/EgtB/PvdO family nonheme iron enzyme [Chryseolinea sp. H1M3-3]
MKVLILVLSCCIVFASTSGQQQRRVIQGKVIDSKTKLPLSRASVRVRTQSIELASDATGAFNADVATGEEYDSLEVSHVGYKKFKISLNDIHSPLTILLEDYSLQLRTLTITSRKLNLKEVDHSLRKIKGNLYCYEYETTNSMYNLFLNFLEEQDQQDLLKLCNYDLTAYDDVTKSFYENYGHPFKGKVNKKDTSETNYMEYPAVNISHEGAVLFCQWFSEQYNNHTGKKKFKKVRFRLPTQNEWQIAALGYDKFQSWMLDENLVEVIIPADTLTEIKKGKKAMISAREIKYPWFGHYNYRNKVTNTKNCYLGNFKARALEDPCAVGTLPGHDGWTKMALTTSYFPNDIGLYDVVGNVAEMIDEKGKAYGGSWDDIPEESTIRSVKSYAKPDDTIGFRVFMEVVEE